MPSLCGWGVLSLEQLLTGAEAVFACMEDGRVPIALAEPRRLQQFGGITPLLVALLVLGPPLFYSQDLCKCHNVRYCPHYSADTEANTT